MKESGKITWYKTIRIKLIAAMILTITAVLGTAGIFAYDYFQDSELNELNGLAVVSATRIANHLSVPMWFIDREQVGSLLAAELKEQRVTAIVVWDEDGSTLFAAKKRNRGGKIVDSDGKIFGDFTHVQNQVVYEGNPIGKISVYLTPKFMYQKLNQFKQGVLAIVIGLDIIIIIIMILVTGRVLIRPLLKVTAAAEKISLGDFSNKIEVQSNDEIGLLSTTINRMQTSLAMAMKALKKS